ncbi:MAG: hypothetical protein IJC25_07380 [Clostridia bacterium]|nr:hypothetical protein [Clostridia bacterium]
MKKTLCCLLAILLLVACAPAESSLPQSSVDTGSVTSSVESVPASSVESIPVIESGTAPAPTQNQLILAYDTILKTSFKGLEIYCWSAEDGTARCGVLPGTNRVKTADDFAYLYQYPATPEQMAELVKNLDEETYLLVFPMSENDAAAASAVYAALDDLGFYNLERLDAAYTDELTYQYAATRGATTQDWSGFDINDEDVWMVNLRLPSYVEWDGEGTTTFMNQRNGIKFMELWPVVFMGEDGAPYDREPTEPGEGDSVVISQQNFSLPNVSGVLRISKTNPSGGAVEEWYPHTYWVVTGTVALGVTLYSLEADGSDTALFERIIDSVTFLPAGMGM